MLREKVKTTSLTKRGAFEPQLRRWMKEIGGGEGRSTESLCSQNSLSLPSGAVFSKRKRVRYDFTFCSAFCDQRSEVRDSKFSNFGRVRAFLVF